jgi:DNA-binding MarR family transcriptional regulator
MPAFYLQDLVEAIIDFEEQYNDKLSSLFAPIRGKNITLTKMQAKTLFLLYHRLDQTPSALGEALGMSKASLTGIVDTLEASGLARRSNDKKDRRRYLITLTDTGRLLCKSKIKELDDKLERRFAPLSEAQRLDFARYLKMITDLLHEMED